MQSFNSQLFLVFLFTLIAPMLFGQEKSQLSIHVSNIKEAKGNIMIAVYESDETFLGKNVQTGFIVPVTQKGDLEFPVKDLPTGNYAISVYHDKNENQTLDSNLLSIPTEPYGFSNNAKVLFGPPSFESSKVEIKSGKQVINIALK